MVMKGRAYTLLPFHHTKQIHQLSYKSKITVPFVAMPSPNSVKKEKFPLSHLPLTSSILYSSVFLVEFTFSLKKADITNDVQSRKTNVFFNCGIRIYTKVFLKFPSTFWQTGAGTEFFLYAHQRRGYYAFWQHMENAYPGSNILVVTVTDEESKRIEEQTDEKTKAEAMAVLRRMFGDGIPEAEQILVPRWWNNRFQRGSYSNYPIFVNPEHFHDMKAPVGPIYFTGEHTSEKFNGYVHGGYLSGIDTANMVAQKMKEEETE